CFLCELCFIIIIYNILLNFFIFALIVFYLFYLFNTRNQPTVPSYYALLNHRISNLSKPSNISSIYIIYCAIIFFTIMHTGFMYYFLNIFYFLSILDRDRSVHILF